MADTPVDPEEAAARLRKIVSFDGAKYRPLYALLTALLTEREEMKARIAAVEALHTMWKEPQYVAACNEDGCVWPCATVRALRW